MAKLVIHRGGALDRRIDLEEREYRIGRGDQNDIVLPDPARGVSRLHAQLVYEGGQFVVCDLDSQNGIWLEGKKIHRAALTPGVAVTLGPYQLALEQPEAVTAASAPVARPAPPAAAPSPPVDAPRPTAAPPPPPAPARKVGAPGPVSGPPVRSGGGTGRRVALLAVLFVLLAVVGVGIGLYWPTDSSRVAVSAPAQPTASGQPPSETPSTTPGEVAPPPDAAAAAGQAAAVAPPAGGLPGPSQQAPTIPAAQVPPSSGQAGKVAAPVRGQASQPAPSADPKAPPRRQGETPAAWRARTRQVQDWYKQGTTALRDGDFPGAIARFEAILAQETAYLDSASLLEDARRNLRASAQQAFDDGLSLEKSGDLAGAAERFQRASAIDPGLEGLEAAASRLSERMRAAGEDAFKRARQYDALGRTAEAVAQYERAVQWLPADHESRKVARERLEVLKGGIK